jgi:hypothetical protein
MKQIRLISDLHIDAFYGMEIDKLFDVVCPSIPDLDKDSILVIAGDVSHHIHQCADFIYHACQKFEHVVFVPGNHEYYRNDYTTWASNFLTMFDGKQPKATNLYFPGNDVLRVEIAGFPFILGTLWGWCPRRERLAVHLGLNDFRIISNGDEGMFTVDAMCEVGRRHRHSITELAREVEGNKYIVTHHLPVPQAVSQRFVGSPINGGFLNDCTEILPEIGQAWWMFGHTHDHVSISVGNVKFSANPFGYRHEWGSEYNRYQPTFIPLFR